MEEPSFQVADGEITGIRFGLASHREICSASVSGSAISHASQLSNPYLGLPLEFGKCEACGTSEPGNCEGHFGYIELPIAIYHPSHVSELKRLLSALCLKCLKIKKNKLPVKTAGIAEQLLGSCCEDASLVSIGEVRKDGYWYLNLKVPSKRNLPRGFWNFLERYGFKYGGSNGEVLSKRTLLPCEVLEMLKKISADTKKKLIAKGFFPQDGYILQYLPVPPNCLSVPEISDGVTVMSSDPATAMLRKVLKQIEIIKSSRSLPNFESLEVEANELQLAVDQYLQARGTVNVPRDMATRYGTKKDEAASSRKVWPEMMKRLFIQKGSGFSSRSVITGDSYKAVNEVGVPYEIAKHITFEERVSQHNVKFLQELVDQKMCLTYKDGSSRYSLREGSKGHTFLKPGQVVHRRIMDGDIVFINRPPTTHKHSLQALKVYIHDDHTVKINPLICGPLSADFDGDCIHLFYPQSTAAKAEVLELFALEKQILSSHSGNLIVQLASDSLLSLKMMFKTSLMDKVAAQQLAMFTSSPLLPPAFWLPRSSEMYWTTLQILQTALPSSFTSYGERFLIKGSEIMVLDYARDAVSSVINDIGTSICFEKGSEEVLKFFNALQPLLMENVFSQGFSVGLEDFSISQESIQDIQKDLQGVSQLLYHLRSTYNELVDMQLEDQIRLAKLPVLKFILRSSSLGSLIEIKSEGAINKTVQQIGFLGLQISDRGKFYSKTLVEDVASLYKGKYPENIDYPAAEFGFVNSCYFRGLDPYEELVHSISTREIIVRSSRGLSEPGTLFKNLMAILRDVVVCYDGTVRNVCSNSIIQFSYGDRRTRSLYPPGEPVGVLAATAMSNPAYKAVLDASPSSNSSWEFMKEILLCKANFRNELIDRRVILYLNDCGCGRNYCREKAAYLVKDQLTKVSLKDTAVEFLIEYRNQSSVNAELERSAGIVGHVHLNKRMLKEKNIGMPEILQKCEETISSFKRMKKVGKYLKKAILSFSDGCSFHKSDSEETSQVPCLLISLQDAANYSVEISSRILAESICPFLLETIIKGDTRICSANITWSSPDSITWIRNPQNSDNGELAVDVCLEKSAVKQSGDAWRIVIDSCLPVLHLIDTRRSIPYGIKQIEQLLGITCVFDQAVQRLSTSVSSVSKGVLKEHLLLLANSMSYSGIFIGFNSGGYKALSKSLNVQVPFTEATLITPKKCFERAAEKCHVDSLNSIVASCSWGKHVAIGTGSRFDILWDTRGVEFNPKGGVDVHNFLHMVGAENGEEVSIPGCLGVDIDDIMPDNIAEDCRSPEKFNSDKPAFEDTNEFVNLTDDVPGASGWENDVSSKGGSRNGNAWDVATHNWSAAAPKTDATAGWGENGAKNKNPPSQFQEPSGSWDTVAAWGTNSTVKNAESDTNWGKADTEGGSKSNNGWSSNANKTKSGESDSSGWNKEKPESGGWNSASNSGYKAKNDGESDLAGWNKEKPVSGGWDSASNSGYRAKHAGESDSAGWNKDKPGSGDWNSASNSGYRTKNAGESDSAGWNKDKLESGGWNSGSNSGYKAKNAGWSDSFGNEDQSLPDQRNEPGGWSSKLPAKKATSGWSNSVINEDRPSSDQANQRGGWDNMVTGKKAVSGWSGSVTNEDQQKEAGGWGSKVTPKKATSGWSDSIRNEDRPSSDQVNDQGGWGNKVTAKKAISGWSDTVRNEDSHLSNQGKEPGGWDDMLTPKKVTSGWSDSVKNKDSPMADQSKEADDWGSKVNLKKSSTATDGWGTKSPSSQAVEGSGRAGDGLLDTPWVKRGSFQERRSESPGGWGPDSGDWKIKKNNRPFNRPPGGNSDPGLAKLFTESRQRLDMFTSEEQEVLTLVEPIMKSIRRIMHQSGYTDGEPIPAEDQTFITENVFNYHPEKDAKMGAGIDHFTVSKHTNFSDTRCFFVVSTDGGKQDFSYRKCLGNMVKSKFPEIADEFLEKYFRKPRPPGGGNRDQNSNPDRPKGTLGGRNSTPENEKSRGTWGRSPTPESSTWGGGSTQEPSEPKKTQGNWGGGSTQEPSEPKKTQGNWGGGSTPEPGNWGSGSTQEPLEPKKAQENWGSSSTPESGNWGGGSNQEPSGTKKAQGNWGGGSTLEPSEPKKSQGNWGDSSTPEPGNWGGGSTQEPSGTKKAQGNWGGGSTQEPSEPKIAQGNWGGSSTTEPGNWGGGSTQEPSPSKKSTQGNWG